MKLEKRKANALRALRQHPPQFLSMYHFRLKHLRNCPNAHGHFAGTRMTNNTDTMQLRSTHIGGSYPPSYNCFVNQHPHVRACVMYNWMQPRRKTCCESGEQQTCVRHCVAGMATCASREHLQICTNQRDTSHVLDVWSS